MRVQLGVVLACVSLQAACHKDAAPPPEKAPLSPEAVAASAAAGDMLTVQGTVYTVTFDSEKEGDEYRPKADRYILIRSLTRPPKGVTMNDLDIDAIDGAWTLGLHVAPKQIARREIALPALGAVVRATGRFERALWNGKPRAMLSSLTALAVVSGESKKADLDAPCTNDMDCRDELICSRASRICALTPEPIEWGSDWRSVNGACDTDDDCPLGQSCDLAHAIGSDGRFAAPYHRIDVGRHLCQPKEGLGPRDLCPTPAEPADLAGGRFVTGKEICVHGEVLLEANAADGDTHIQLIVAEPFPFPLADAPYYLFGATTENVPPFKDPTMRSGPLADPPVHQRIIVLGTYRFDAGHGWFEVHPIKRWWAE